MSILNGPPHKPHKPPRGSWRERLKNAFAVDPPGATEPTPEQQPAIDWLCKQIAKRRLTTPGLIALEMCRPLNYVGAQAMHVFQPFAWALATEKGHENYVHLSQFLEKRGSMEYMMRRIEHFEAEYEGEERRRAAEQRQPPPPPADQNT